MSRFKTYPPAELLAELFSYDPNTGLLVRRVTTSAAARAGDVVGYKSGAGYLSVSIDKRQYYVHRVIYVMMTGALPPEFIDHRNGVRDDNRWLNLRPATARENCCNTARSAKNKSGFKGVSRIGRRWRAYISHNRKAYDLGGFPTPQEAAAAYRGAAVVLHGEFMRRAA